MVVGAVDMAVVPPHAAGFPRLLAVEAVNNLLGQRDGGARRCVELMHVVGLGQLNVVLRELVHDLGQIPVDSREDGHANGEVARPEESLLAVFGQRFNVGLVVFHPTRRTAHHLHIVGEGLKVVAVGSRRIGKLNGHIGRGKGRTVKVSLVVYIYLTHNFVAAGNGNLLNHMTHLAIANQCYLHNLIVYISCKINDFAAKIAPYRN